MPAVRVGELVRRPSATSRLVTTDEAELDVS